MPFDQRSVMDSRVEFVLCAKKHDRPFSHVCEEHGISRTTGYLWMDRYETAGSVMGLLERSRRPHNSPAQTAKELEEAVIRLREHYGWGARKLRVLLNDEGYDLPEITINRILKRKGLIKECDSIPKATKRFERSSCNQMFQMDFKGEYELRGGKCYPLSLIDDRSRYLVGLSPLTDTKAVSVKGALEKIFIEYGTPGSMLMDHGTPWWSTTNGHGLTELSVWLMQHGVRLIYSGMRHPQTQGKVERFHRTLKARTKHRGLPSTIEEWEQWAQEFRDEYNQKRPHEAIGMKRPCEVYSRENLRPYIKNPREWDYGDATTHVLNTQGCMDYKGHRYFVCEALRGKRVRVDEVDHLVLVTFCNTVVREIDLRTGRTIAVVLPQRTISQGQSVNYVMI